MKKITLYTILVLAIIMLAGCKKKNIVLTTDDVKVSTVAVKNDGTVQAATVEEFTKNYYNLTELDNFIGKEINNYNEKTGKESIKKVSLETKDNSAILILNYASIEDYASFNSVEAVHVPVTQITAISADLDLPEVYTSASDGSYVNADTAFKNAKYKIVIFNEALDLQVEGDIKYYSNGVLVDDYVIQTGAEGTSFIIYKPY
ncbi:MAG: hypothetical protein K0R92_1978 [Lachnospiraceae bacterium]|jgi:hypothetical protein|nr:hypothetical protein [Lachnospiraceae bacterium]